MYDTFQFSTSLLTKHIQLALVEGLCSTHMIPKLLPIQVDKQSSWTSNRQSTGNYPDRC